MWHLMLPVIHLNMRACVHACMCVYVCVQGIVFADLGYSYPVENGRCGVAMDSSIDYEVSKIIFTAFVNPKMLVTSL